MLTSTARSPRRRAAWLGAAITAAVLATAPGAGAQAPSSAHQQGTAPVRTSVPPLSFRQAMARRLRAEGHPAQARRALRPRRAVRAGMSLTGDGIGFSIPTLPASCVARLTGGNATRKTFTILPPIVLAYDQPSQWVYYQPYVYAPATGDTWPLAGQQQLAYSTTRAPFTPTTWEYDAAWPPQSVAMYVYWWSNTRGVWMQGRAWDLPMHVLTYAGTSLQSNIIQSRC